MTDIKTGDRVRFTFEGEVDFLTSEGRVRITRDDDFNTFGWATPGADGVTIEKIEPPVEVFKPGDVVRSKNDPRYVYAVTQGNRYIYLAGSPELLGGEFGPMPRGFTSDRYEKVPLG